jgi:thioredoxin 1
MMEIPKLSEATFEPQVLQAAGPVIVDFTAVWCHPCKMLDPIVKQLAEEWQGKVKFVKLDIDDNPGLTQTYGVMGVPTLMLFVNGKAVERVTGFQQKEALKKRFGPRLGL